MLRAEIRFFSCASVFFALSAFASGTAAEVDRTAPQPLEAIRARLDQAEKKLRLPAPRALARAQAAFLSGHYEQARLLARGALASTLFADYAHWIIAEAALADAASAAGAKRWKDEAALAQQAFTHLQAIQDEYPDSPFRHRLPTELATAELLWGEGLGASTAAVSRLKSAFARLSNAGGLNVSSNGGDELTPARVLSFARACARHPDKSDGALCLPWIFHLTAHMSHQAASGQGGGDAEFQTIARLFPEVLDRPRAPPQAAHDVQAYKGVDLDQDAFDKAMQDFLVGKWGSAEDKFKTFATDFPKSAYRYRARYWLAQALEKDRHANDAKAAFESLRADSPLSYYGLLAALKTSASPSTVMDQLASQPAPRVEPSPGPSFGPAFAPLAAERDASLTVKELYHLQRAEILLSAKAPELTLRELREIHARAGMSSPLVMYLAVLGERAHAYSTVFTALSELFLRELPGLSSENGVLQMIFPIVDFDRIKKYSSQTALDPVLVLSLIKQESAFDPEALSSSGAQGLMQLMPFTAAGTLPGITRRELLTADRNIETGTLYLSRLMAHFRGNAVLAIAGYNAGPSAVDRWIKDAPQKAPLEMLPFIETIPYRETREYVASIIRNYFWYAKLLGVQSPMKLEDFWKPPTPTP